MFAIPYAFLAPTQTRPHHRPCHEPRLLQQIDAAYRSAAHAADCGEHAVFVARRRRQNTRHFFVWRVRFTVAVLPCFVDAVCHVCRIFMAVFAQSGAQKTCHTLGQRRRGLGERLAGGLGCGGKHRTGETQKNPYILLHIDHPIAFLDMQVGACKAEAKRCFKIFGTPVAIACSELAVDAHDLYLALQSQHQSFQAEQCSKP